MTLSTKKLKVAQLAEVLGVAEATIKKTWLKHSPPCPSFREGRLRFFDLDKVQRWRDKNNIVTKAGRPTTQTPNERELTETLIKERIRKLKFDNDVKEGLLIDAEAERQRDIAKLAYFKNHLEDAATKWAIEVDGMTTRERETHLKKAVAHLLEEMAR